MKSTGLKKNLTNFSSVSDRKALVDLGHKHITVKRQTDLLDINRSSAYREHPVKLISDEELLIMRLIDKIHTNEPTWGYRTITAILGRGYDLLINRKRVRRNYA
jgi:putative transposase